ncbi:MAG: methyltransferase domain-containing protein [Treponema sp.]|nr:methyltransferase domain-containing protein [Treponema sp.]
MNSGSVLVVPAIEKGRGGGHLARSAALVHALRSQNREAYLFGRFGSREQAFCNNLDSAWVLSDEKALQSRTWGFIVLDRFQTSQEEFARWSASAPLIGIDEGGDLRDRFDFLIDLLPGPPGGSAPNILDPRLLPLPARRRTSFYLDRKGRLLKTLVSFGAEDPENLTVPVCQALASPENTEITALFGVLNRSGDGIPRLAGVRTAEGIPELREHLAEYDLVITHFGLTAFECIHAGVPVALVSPGAYHEKLARHAGFMSAGIRAKGGNRLKELLYKKPSRSAGSPAVNEEFLKVLGELGERIGARYGLHENLREPYALGDLLGSYALHVPAACPACGSQERFNHRVLARFPDRTYRRCPRCGMAYMLRTCPPPIVYERDYFFDFYKKQYGKTYLEDFPNLIRNAKTRLTHIKAMLQSRGKGPLRLLDIGCAYGPFLAAAREEGFSPTGIDPAEDAVKYVQKELKIPAFQGFFPDTPLPDVLKAESFDAISLWYVIEHFEKPGEALGEIYRLLKPGGVLAFSTPSFSGVSARTSAAGFLEKSPQDHWTVWEPRYTGAILKRRGFTLKKTVISGHHPERFPLIGPLLTGKHGFLYGLCLQISSLFGLGDTFEAYAVKNRVDPGV